MGRVYETAVKIGATISKAFKSDTYNAAAALTKLSAATKQLKDAEKAASAYKKLSSELTRAKGRYDTASAALRRLEDAERAAGGATKESTKWRKAGEREVAAAARQLDRATKAAQKNGEALTKLGVDTAKMATEQDRLTRSLAATERQEKSLERYEHARERLFGAPRERTPLMEKAGEQFKSVGETILHLAEAGAVAGEAMHLLVEKTISSGANIGETAEKIGIGARALQQLRYGAQQSGAEVEDLDRALEKMAVNIGKHRMMKGKAGGGPLSIPGVQTFAANDNAGSAGAVDPFKAIGLSAKALSTLKPEEQIKKIADGLLTLKTHAERANIAQEIFGKGAAAILPYLAEGAEGIEKLSKNADKYGGVLTDEQIAAAIEAEKASKDMNLALAGVANTLGAALLPTAVKTFRGISSWVGSNRAQIKAWAENAAKWIETKGIPTFKHIAVEVQSFASKVMHLIDVGAKLTGGIGNLAIVVAGLRLAPLAVTLGKIAIEGTKAAIAVVRYVAASKAAKAAGAISGGGPGSFAANAGTAMGVAAKASMILGAAAIGYAIGTAIDEATGGKLSDTVAKALGYVTGQGDKLKKIEDTGVAAHDTMLQRKALERQGLIRQYEAQGIKHGLAVYYADHGGPPAVPRTNAGGARAAGPAAVIHIHGHHTRAGLERALDDGKRKALEDFDRREANRRRLSYGG